MTTLASNPLAAARCRRIKPGRAQIRVQRMARRWRKTRPDSGGWWLWREGGRSRIEKLLLCEGGSEVATDDEWEQATGEQAERDGWTENYWEMTATTQKEMPGLWMKAPSVVFSDPHQHEQTQPEKP